MIAIINKLLLFHDEVENSKNSLLSFFLILNATGVFFFYFEII